MIFAGIFKFYSQVEYRVYMSTRGTRLFCCLVFAEKVSTFWVWVKNNLNLLCTLEYQKVFADKFLWSSTENLRWQLVKGLWITIYLQNYKFNKDWIDWSLTIGSRTKLIVMVGIFTFETRRLKTIFCTLEKFFVQPFCATSAFKKWWSG